MHLSDPLQGYRLLSGFIMLHYAFFFILCMLPEWATFDVRVTLEDGTTAQVSVQEEVLIGTAYKAMYYAHLVGIVLTLLSTCCFSESLTIRYTMDLFSILLYQGVAVFAQTQILQLSEKLTE